MTEHEANVTDGFRNESFEAEVTDIGVKEISGYSTANIEFDDGGPSLNIFAPNEIIDGTVPGYHAMGVFINSLKQFGIKTFLDVDDDTKTLDGIRTEPDICGMVVTLELKERKYIQKTTGEEKINKEWRVIKAEGNSTTPPASAQQPTPTPTPKSAEPTAPADNDSDDMDTWTTIILDAIADEPKTAGQIMNAMKKEYPERADYTRLNKTRSAALKSMVESGDIKQDGSKYSMA